MSNQNIPGLNLPVGSLPTGIEAEDFVPVTIPTGPLKSRLTVYKNLYFNHLGRNVEMTPIRYDVESTSDEEPFKRTIKVGPDWVKPAIAWSPPECLFILENREGTNLRVYPTKEEAKETAAKVVEVGIQVGDIVRPFTRVRPGQATDFEPEDLGLVRLRCRSGTAECYLTIYPV